MKNSIKLFTLAAILIAAASCENKPSTMSYTLAGQFDYVSEYPKEFPAIDSVYYNKYIMLDKYSALRTECDDVNSGFNGGWRVSLKKGSFEEPANLQLLSSAGKYAGVYDSDSRQGHKSYAVYCPSASTYDIEFKYKDYFSKSTCYVTGFWINNTKYVEKLADEGQIPEGGLIKVVANFYKNDVKVCEEEYTLLDFTGLEHKLLRDWTAWEMKTAKNFDVDAVKFSVTTSSADLPPYFCLDFLIASVSVEY